MLNYCGESRKGNRFCLRLEDAEGLMNGLSRLFEGNERSLRNIPFDEYRYASINIEALKKYGSLEFRALSGTVDVARITTWCTALYNIRKFAMEQENPSRIHNLYIQQEAEGFMKNVLGEVSPSFEYPEMIKGIQRSFSLSIDLPFSYSSAQADKMIADGHEHAFREIMAKAKPIAIQPMPRVNPLRFIMDEVAP